MLRSLRSPFRSAGRRAPKISAAALGALLAAFSGARLAAAQDPADTGSDIGLGLTPGTPQVGTLPGGIAPAYGQKSEDEADYRFDYHGFITMPYRVGLN